MGLRSAWATQRELGQPELTWCGLATETNNNNIKGQEMGLLGRDALNHQENGGD